MAEKQASDDDDDDVHVQEKIGLIKLKTQAKLDDKDSISQLLKGLGGLPPVADNKNSLAKNRLLANLMPPPPLPPPPKQSNNLALPENSVPKVSTSSLMQLADELRETKLDNRRLERLSDCLQMENEIILDLYNFTKHIKNPISCPNTTKIKSIRQGAHYVPRSLSKLHGMLSRERTLLCGQIANSISEAVGFDAQPLVRPRKDEEVAHDWQEKQHSLMLYFNFNTTPET